MEQTNNQKQIAREKIEKLRRSNFKQQNLLHWRPPQQTTKQTIILVFTLSVIFTLVGSLLYLKSAEVFEQVMRYDNICPINTTHYCNITFEIKQKVEAPIYFYYELTNFFQNHRRIVTSVNNEQLGGKWLDVDQLRLCAPMITYEQMGINKSVSGKYLDPKLPANPCGLLAKSIFNDTFTITQIISDPNSQNKTNRVLNYTEKDIAWETDVQLRYKRLNRTDWADYQWIDVTSEHFIQWMRAAGVPHFRNRYLSILEDLHPGNYTLSILSLYDTQTFKGTKLWVLTTTNQLGAKNYFLASCYLIFGFLSFAFGIIISIQYMREKKQHKNKKEKEKEMIFKSRRKNVIFGQ